MKLLLVLCFFFSVINGQTIYFATNQFSNTACNGNPNNVVLTQANKCFQKSGSGSFLYNCSAVGATTFNRLDCSDANCQTGCSTSPLFTTCIDQGIANIATTYGCVASTYEPVASAISQTSYGQTGCSSVANTIQYNAQDTCIPAIPSGSSKYSCGINGIKITSCTDSSCNTGCTSASTPYFCQANGGGSFTYTCPTPISNLTCYAGDTDRNNIVSTSFSGPNIVCLRYDHTCVTGDSTCTAQQIATGHNRTVFDAVFSSTCNSYGQQSNYSNVICCSTDLCNAPRPPPPAPSVPSFSVGSSAGSQGSSSAPPNPGSESTDISTFGSTAIEGTANNLAIGVTTLLLMLFLMLEA